MPEGQHPLVSVPARQLSMPSSISPGAQEALAMTFAPMPPMPTTQDAKTWTDWVGALDAEILPFLGPAADQIPLARPVETLTFGTAKIFEIAPVGATGDVVYLTIHGGAFVACGGDVGRAMSIIDAVEIGELTWAVDYRMPPHNPYPAPVDDCLIAYQELLKRFKPEQIVVAGASAGGNLAAAMILRAGDMGLPMPAGLMLLSPEVDLTESGDSFQTHMGIDTVLNQSLMTANLLYAGGQDLAHPYLSPLFADFNGRPFPPTYITAGTRDLFLSNAVRMHRVLRQAGLLAELHVFEAAPHGLALGQGTPEHDDYNRERRRFIREICSARG